MRSRILDFEKEIDERIEALLILETEILNTAQLRKQWLTSVSCNVGGDSQSLRRKLEILRAQSELLSVQLRIDVAKMEGFYESQTLSVLVAATKPYDVGESEEKRKKVLDSLLQDNVEDLKDNLSQSTIFRSSLLNNVTSLSQNTDALKFEYEQQNALMQSELQRRIAQYTIQLKESLTSSKVHDREITGDYLVLRHNSRVAKEMLVRSQSDAALSRRALQEGIDSVSAAAAAQRDKIEQSSEIELQTLTDVIRSQLLKHEQDYEDLRLSRFDRIKTRKQTIKRLTETCEQFNEKHKDMQIQRKNDLVRVGGELKRLR